MKGRDLQGGGQFRVVCTWCGAVIGPTTAGRTSRGMCLECYARMLHDYNRTYRRAGEHFKASER